MSRPLMSSDDIMEVREVSLEARQAWQKLYKRWMGPWLLPSGHRWLVRVSGVSKLPLLSALLLFFACR